MGEKYEKISKEGMMHVTTCPAMSCPAMSVEPPSHSLPLSSFNALWTSGVKSYPDAVPEKIEGSTHPEVPPRQPICSSSLPIQK